MKNEIDVSIIIPAYNGAETIDSLVNKILSETRMAVERIIVDDGSADETVSVLCQRHDGLPILTEQAHQSVYGRKRYRLSGSSGISSPL